MNVATNRKLTPKSWLIATSAGVLLVILGYSILVSVSDTRKLYLYNQLQIALENDDFQKAHTSVEEMHQDLAIMKVINALKLRSVDLSTEYHEKENTLFALKITRAISERDFPGAEVLFKELMLNIFEIEQLLSKKGRETGPKELIRALDLRLDGYGESLKAFKKFQDELDINATKRKSLFERLRLIAGDFGDFLSLDPEEVEESDFYENIYERGVLKGLPMVDGISDNLEEFADLKKQLTRSGGGVDIQGRNPAQVFQSKLKEIRGLVSELEVEFSALETIEKALNEESAESREELSSTRNLAQKKFKDLVLKIAKPNSGAIAEALYPFLNLS